MKNAVSTLVNDLEKSYKTFVTVISYLIKNKYISFQLFILSIVSFFQLSFLLMTELVTGINKRKSVKKTAKGEKNTNVYYSFFIAMQKRISPPGTKV